LPVTNFLRDRFPACPQLNKTEGKPYTARIQAVQEKRNIKGGAGSCQSSVCRFFKNKSFSYY
jgi:hypothetical protein